ncbi:MAG: beta-phosphoglucomutase [Saprospiraceae bacterium]|nr:MAG: beta-phosphoglucomutase [Saprospiraceae bacterium]
MIKACIFDLDGVIVDTAKYHFQAWRRLAQELGFDFTETENEKLKGVSRMQSLDLILSWGGVVKTAKEKAALAAKKNDWYVQLISTMTPSEILEGVLEFLNELRSKRVKIGLGSASKNALTILEKIGLRPYFDALIDGNQTTKSKPDPEVFLLGATALGVAPSEAIVFEDAAKGIEAALAGGFWAIGIGAQKDLKESHAVIPGFKNYDFEKITALLRR